MKILHLIDTLSPAAGGPTTVALRLAAAQARLGHEVGILSYLNEAERPMVQVAREAVPGMAAVQVGFIPQPSRLSRILARRARPALEQHIAGIDLLHIHTLWEPLLRVGARLAARRGTPYVVTPHGVLDPWSLQQKAFKKRLALALGYRRMLHGAAFLHALNVDEKQLLAPLRLRCPVEVVPNGIFLEELDPLPPAGSFHAAHPELAGRPYVLFLSRLHYKKGLDYLAAAFAQIAPARPEVDLVIAGPDGGAQADFQREIARQGLTRRVHIVGPLYGREKYAALVDAACFCLPSRQEGFSMAITEALACGLPVVISKACHFPEVSRHGAGEEVDLDAPAVAAALLRVLSDEAARRRMGASGMALVREHYTWPHIAELMLEAYGRHGAGTLAACQK